MTVRLEKKQGKTVIYQNRAPMEAAVPGTSSASARKSVPETGLTEESTQSQSEKHETEGKVITSPLVGVFYAAPAEDADAFVQVGDTVKKGQVLAIVEAMKLMNEIESDYDGTIAEILVENGQAVEYGQPLFKLQ